MGQIVLLRNQVQGLILVLVSLIETGPPIAIKTRLDSTSSIGRVPPSLGSDVSLMTATLIIISTKLMDLFSG